MHALPQPDRQCRQWAWLLSAPKPACPGRKQTERKQASQIRAKDQPLLTAQLRKGTQASLREQTQKEMQASLLPTQKREREQASSPARQQASLLKREE